MWLFTPEFFVSVVEKGNDRKDGKLTLRTRNRADIDALVAKHFPEAKPYRVKHSDYAWRIRVPKDQWALACARMAMEVDYSNFKDRVTELQGKERHDVYLKVWFALLALKDRPRGRRRRRQVEPLLRDSPYMLTDRDYDDLLGGRL